MDVYQIIRRPLITEKGTFQSAELNSYPFEVALGASKQEIKEAMEALFEVKVVKVRTQNRPGKPRRYRHKYGRTRQWKKAIITLSEEDRIDFF